jgi:CRISPR/Cas system-associated protein Cas10 (large subunit of type III CRISPR-Cas system)
MDDKLKELLSEFELRKANPPKQIDNSSLYAGSPMYFYCKYCGHESDILPESYTERPNHICSSCKPLVKAGLI